VLSERAATKSALSEKAPYLSSGRRRTIFGRRFTREHIGGGFVRHRSFSRYFRD
jgi:hypothetical protein